MPSQVKAILAPLQSLKICNGVPTLTSAHNGRSDPTVVQLPQKENRGPQPTQSGLLGLPEAPEGNPISPSNIREVRILARHPVFVNPNPAAATAAAAAAAAAQLPLPKPLQAPEALLTMNGPQEEFVNFQDRAQSSNEDKSSCRMAILGLFPDIDPEYLTNACEKALWVSAQVIEGILNAQEKGESYPKAPMVNLKRKRQVEDDEPAADHPAKRWENEERRQQHKPASYLKTCNDIMQHNFPQLYVDDMRKYMDQNHRLFYPTFLGLARMMHAWQNGQGDQPFRIKGRAQKAHPFMTDDAIAQRLQGDVDLGEREALEEFRAARAVFNGEIAEAEEQKRKEKEELANFEKAKLEGNIAECGCCFVEHALNKMVHCDGETLHWFCRDCARMMAETQIGLGKYNLDCMSTDGCTGHFRIRQQEIFLDKNSLTALSRIEQEAILREAGIENLETCPYCPFAMEYPSIDEDKEFRCLNPECEVVSCRACRTETHLPKTCAEAATDRGQSARHAIEEAMSAALIRRCNKCSAPFIKENGCNKMTCTKCRNTQCYICSKSCDYTHFNDVSRGGKMGQCPLFDVNGIDALHAEEVSNAEMKAREQVLQEHMDMDSSLLEIRTSDKVKPSEKGAHHPRREVNREQLARRWGGIREKLRPAIAEPGLLNGLEPQARPHETAAHPFLPHYMPPRHDFSAGYRRIPEPVATFVPVAQVAPPAVLVPRNRRDNRSLTGAEAQDAVNSVLGVQQLGGASKLPLRQDANNIGRADHRHREAGTHEQGRNIGQPLPNTYGPISTPLQPIPSPWAGFGGLYTNYPLVLPRSPLVTVVPPQQQLQKVQQLPQLPQLQQVPGFPQAGPGAPYLPEQPQPANPMQQVLHQNPTNYIGNFGFPPVNREQFAVDWSNWVDIEPPRERANRFPGSNVISRDAGGGGGGGGGEEGVSGPRRP